MPPAEPTARRRRGVTLACGLLALAAVAGGGCSPPAGDSAAQGPPPPNVMLISIDTLRADHLGCYGYPRPTSPAIDDFCRDAVVFRQAIAHAPSTLHSHASMLSSLLPHHHRASWDGRTRLPEEVITLAEVLRDAGYRTAAFTGGGQMDRSFGLDQGFDSYEQPGGSRFAAPVEKSIEWLGAHGDRPFLLFLHTYEVHHPYSPEERFFELFRGDYSGPLGDEIPVELLREINRGDRDIDEADLAHIVNAYDAEIRSMDEAFGELVAYLEMAGLYDDTLIVLTSDHGEEFDEHGQVGWHSHSLYDELLHVPLIVKYPGSRHAGKPIEAQVRSLDIPPSVLGAVGLPSPRQFLGVDLATVIEGSAGPLPAISRMDRAAHRRDFSSIRTDGWKLYRGRLFDLSNDPGEQWDAASSHTEQVAELERRMAEIVASREPHAVVQVAPPETTLEELRALGYIQ